MKFIYNFLLVLLLLTSSIFSQSPIVQQILNSANQDSLLYFVRELSGNVPTIINGTPQTILSRNKYQPGNALAETYIKQKLQSYGLTTTIQTFSTTGKNVYAIQQGTEFPNQKYMICAHYDDMPSGTIAPGADDNASGTAAVIEAARIFSQYSFPFSIIYALWDEEEQGLIGSEFYATQAANSGDSILGVINLDMIAYDGNGDGNADVHNSSIANTGSIKDKMLEVNLLYGINLDLDVVPAQPYSDHQSFLDHGYGAILLIEDDYDFHPYYHTVNDLIQYFNQPYFFKMAKLSFATLASFALNLNMNIIHTPIASTSQSGPLTTTALISTGLEIGTGNLSPRLYYRTRISGGNFGQFTSVMGTSTESGNYSFTIPSILLGTVVQYYLAVQDANSSIVTTLPSGGSGFNPPGSTPPQAFFQFFVAAQSVVLYDEANNLNNWNSSGGWNTTTSKYVSAPTSFTDSPGGNYSNGTTAILRYINQIDLTDVLGATLEFETQWDIEADWDYGQVEISTNNGTTWSALEGLYTNPGTGSFQPPGEPLYDGTQLTWVQENIDISDFVNQNISLRFLLRSDSYITEDGWYVDNIKVTTFESTTTFPLTVSVSDGWNMVSVPGINPEGQSVSDWWAGHTGNVFRYNGAYEAITNALPGEGYWMKNVGAQTYNSGDEWPEIQIVPHDPIDVTSGWNLFGVYEQPLDTADLIGILPPVFGYFQGYVIVDSLFPGYAYWARCSGTQIIFPEGSLNKRSNINSKYFNEEWGKITITDAVGRSTTLYVVKEEVSLKKYELPPSPPAGSFDIRFGTGRIAENLNVVTQTIDLSGVIHPVNVRIKNINIRLQDESGNLIDTKLKDGEEFLITNKQVSKLLVTNEIMSSDFALEQNYPNPFNPKTTISFSIPEDALNVRLSVYNSLGEKVAEIVNSFLLAGHYEYNWDASNFASGIYIYELKADKFISVKKMLLVK